MKPDFSKTPSLSTAVDFQDRERKLTAFYRQMELSLPARSADSIIEEKLSAAVELFNASTDPAERVELHGEITRLRALLRGGK